MAKPKKIPEQLFVAPRVFRDVDGEITSRSDRFMIYDQDEYDFDRNKLSFMQSSHSSYSVLSVLLSPEGTWYEKRYLWDLNGKKIEEVSPLKDQPFVMDNVPMRGFEFARPHPSSQNRARTSVEVVDPRGYRFPITAVAFEKLVLSTTINSGVIEDLCVWMSPSNLVKWVQNK